MWNAVVQNRSKEYYLSGVSFPLVFPLPFFFFLVFPECFMRFNLWGIRAVDLLFFFYFSVFLFTSLRFFSLSLFFLLFLNFRPFKWTAPSQPSPVVCEKGLAMVNGFRNGFCGTLCQQWSNNDFLVMFCVWEGSLFNLETWLLLMFCALPHPLVIPSSTLIIFRF